MSRPARSAAAAALSALEENKRAQAEITISDSDEDDGESGEEGESEAEEEEVLQPAELSAYERQREDNMRRNQVRESASARARRSTRPPHNAT